MDIGTRIKEIRLDKKMTLSEFGERIEMSESHLSKLEKTLRTPTDRTIKLISMEFNVSETWLRTGEGERYNAKLSINREFMDIVARMVRDDDQTTAKILSLLEKMTIEQRQSLLNFLNATIE